MAVLVGLRTPIVLILLAIAFFTSISGKPLDGLLMLVVGVSLAWDAGRTSRAAAGPGATPGAGATPQAGAGATPQAGAGATPQAGAGATRTAVIAHPRRAVLVLAAVAAGACYALVAGSFTRYSWPATVAVIGVGAAGVLIGWQGPRRDRELPEALPVAGTALWGVVFVAGCIWELAALLGQPTLTTSSYHHPTVSTLTDPLLATSPGRSALLLVWLALGWYLVER